MGLYRYETHLHTSEASACGGQAVLSMSDIIRKPVTKE
jgi:hypothetical protein